MTEYGDGAITKSSGASYYRARYYDQNAGRFISEDSIRFKAGVDFYTYVFNDPINMAR
jgi:RHS repeat-associated protein